MKNHMYLTSLLNVSLSEQGWTGESEKGVSCKHSKGNIIHQEIIECRERDRERERLVLLFDLIVTSFLLYFEPHGGNEPFI